uniref:Uncharacterized protein n=1 Tax=Haptolina brevifila TaxID=156173 RepID=A0A7S2DL98_9EUKA|mmetsp:Transcript_40520/g.81278  ORF Transcript_40520/g.81278 Transcript_40520/m.81278 type:complete len:228 (+) Transcript_40520:37-720(+)|eukprot:CAMPEP_0174730134 /NCGR_PEP_ID=MMETSP1094-20130205/55000_1 /TAXON_ID=156173 /ORGANISM="Chrysochromulina brevifilum, Strain UTEX LB 985" /LENGTH=227 /DNA_ID=CAMNT_0015932347 /DNA_START=22 /DNA_END=705 /DNA_ORIENTATION=+
MSSAYADARALTIANSQDPTVVAMQKMSNGQLCVMQSTLIPRQASFSTSSSQGSLLRSSSSSRLGQSRSGASLLSTSRSNSLLTTRRDASSLDAFVLSRPGFVSTYDEHTWHGARPSIHPHGKAPVVAPPFQSTFSINAYKHGLLKPSPKDTTVDRTVTEFVNPHPSRGQRTLAQKGFRALGEQWENHVQTQHANQQAAFSRLQRDMASRSSRTAFPAIGERAGLEL